MVLVLLVFHFSLLAPQQVQVFLSVRVGPGPLRGWNWRFRPRKVARGGAGQRAHLEREPPPRTERQFVPPVVGSRSVQTATG